MTNVEQEAVPLPNTITVGDYQEFARTYPIISYEEDYAIGLSYSERSAHIGPKAPGGTVFELGDYGIQIIAPPPYSLGIAETYFSIHETPGSVELKINQTPFSTFQNPPLPKEINRLLYRQEPSFRSILIR